LLLVVAHAVLLSVAARLHYSVLLAAGAVGIVLLKYGWRKGQRKRMSELVTIVSER
jgi:hypothetical protein